MHTGTAPVRDTHRYGLGRRDDAFDDLRVRTVRHAGATSGKRASGLGRLFRILRYKPGTALRAASPRRTPPTKQGRGHANIGARVPGFQGEVATADHPRPASPE